jgi:hypothetical protein
VIWIVGSQKRIEQFPQDQAAAAAKIASPYRTAPCLRFAFRNAEIREFMTALTRSPNSLKNALDNCRVVHKKSFTPGYGAPVLHELERPVLSSPHGPGQLRASQCEGPFRPKLCKVSRRPLCKMGTLGSWV